MRHPTVTLALLLIVVAGLSRVQGASAQASPELMDPASRKAPASAAALGTASERVTSGVLTFGRNVLDDLRVQGSAPFRYAWQHPGKLAAGVVGVLGLVAADHLTYPRLAAPSLGNARRTMQRIGDVGGREAGLLLVAGIGAFGLAAGSEREKRSATMLAEALVTSGLWTAAFKTLSGRERPREMTEFKSDWAGPTFLKPGEPAPSVGLKSFPSGHSTGAWATATILAHQYPDKGIVPVLAFSGAALVSYSRIAVGAHWLSDVVVGALIGVGSARSVISATDRRALPRAGQTPLHLGVSVTPEYWGLHVRVDI